MASASTLSNDSALESRPWWSRCAAASWSSAFDEQLPPIYSAAARGDRRPNRIEVLAQLDAQHVRGIA
jgi:hypothetical protein